MSVYSSKTASFCKRIHWIRPTIPLILFNDFNGFAQQFQWICLAILPLLLLTYANFAVRFRQSRPCRLSLQSLRNYNIVMVVRAYTTSREERWSVFCFNYVFPFVRSCSPPFKGRGRGGVCILFTTKKIQTPPRPPATPPLEGTTLYTHLK